MGMQVGAELAGFSQGQGQNWSFAALEVDRKLETVSQQRLHHQAQLVLGDGT